MPRLLVLLLLGTACAGSAPQQGPAGTMGVPAWTGDVVWYQIFVERFRNGDQSNDPTAHGIEGSPISLHPRR